MGRVLEAILFDLDNTLYDASTGLQEVGDVRITAWIMSQLGLPHAEADQLRVRTWREYGTTARGLQVEFGVEQSVLYEHAINAIEPAETLAPQPDLDAMLARLSAACHVFTNSPEAYARKVLAALGVSGRFGRIFGIEHNGWESKPDPAIYGQILAELNLRGQQVAFVEDNPRNLQPAAALGMLTVLVGGCDAEGVRVDLQLASVVELAGVLAAAGVRA